MVEEGNSNLLLDKPNLINFEKKRRQAWVIKEVLKFNQIPFNFNVESKIQNFLKKMDVLDEQTLHQFSLLCEPKHDKKN